MLELAHTDLGHLPELYVPYGIAFLLLGVVLLATPKDYGIGQGLRERWLLAGFALMHGCVELWDGWRLLHGLTTGIAAWAASAGLVLSFLPLLEIPRRHLAKRSPRLFGPWIYVLAAALLAAAAAHAERPADAVSEAARLLLAFPGATGTGILILAAASRRSLTGTAAGNRALMLAGACLVAYGVLAGLVVDGTVQRTPALPGALPVEGRLGLPVQALRMIVALLLTACFATVLQSLRRDAYAMRRQAIESVRAMGARLERLVEERTASLRESEDRLRRAQRVAKIGSWYRRLDEDTLLWSDETYRIFGIEPDAEVTTADFRARVAPDDLPRVRQAWRAALERRGSYDVEHRITVEGEEKWLHERAEFELGADGNPIAAIGTVQDVTARRETDRRVREGQLLLRSLIDATPDWIFVKDREYRFLVVNRAFAAGQDLAPQDMVGRADTDFWPRELCVGDPALGYVGFHVDDDRALAGNVVHNPKDVATLADGTERVFDTLKIPLRDQEGSIYGVLAYARDITDRHRDSERLQHTVRQLRDAEARQRELVLVARREQGRLSALLSAMTIGILFEDQGGLIEFVNPAFVKMWGIAPGVALVGRPARAVLEHSNRRFARADHASRHVLHVLDAHEATERFELDLLDGRILTQVSYPVEDDEGHALGRLWLYEDITYERQTAQQLIYLAERDALTGLYNRHRFQSRLEDMVKSALRAGTRFALLYFDLDEFKQVNDNFGHRAGDTVLVRVAGELTAMLRATELFARLGGDEFAVLCNINSVDDVAALASRIVNTVAGIPFRFRGKNIRVTTSVGVAVFPDHGPSTEDLVVRADMAMYQAKAHGRNTWTLFDPRVPDGGPGNERTTWSQRIEHALGSDGVVVHYQGVYRSANGELSHLEALARMRDPHHPDRLILPGQFVPFAERTGQVVDLDRKVLRTVITMLSRSPGIPPVAVNISGRSFDDPSLPQYIHGLLSELGVAPARLLVELTETSAVSDIQDAQRFIEALQALGCRVCLDDFGSGFSSFAYLKYVEVDVLKIDSLFIRDLATNHDNQVFVRAMVDVAAGLDMTTVAEGVETEETYQMVRALGVDLAQGYHLDHPQEHHPALSR